MATLLLTGPPAVKQPPRQFCTFRLGNQLFGVDIANVKEVNTETSLTRIHHAPPHVLGCVNIRGQIYLVLDIRRLLGLTSAPFGPDSRLLIFNPTVGDSLAGLVDRIGDIVAVESARIEPWPQQQRGDEPVPADDLIEGIAKLENELLLILDAKQFLQVVERNLDSESVRGSL
jgi:chemotaxis signal transduction protein